MAFILETNKKCIDLKCILVAWYTFDRKKTKNSNVFLPFHLKPFPYILLITN
jgi:hypothetical protein